jgi:hypothetical protein
MILRFWHPVFGFTEFLQIGASPDRQKIAAFQDGTIYVYPSPGDYDAVAYSQIAFHPLLGAPGLRTTIDNLPYRARRILAPALAWAIAGGNPSRIAHVYAALDIGVWFLLAGLLWRILPVCDGRSWMAWAGVLFSSGVLGNVRLALIDLPALTAIAAALLARELGRPGWATGWLAAAGLGRETSVLALPALWTGERFWTCVRRTLLAVGPLAAWLVYVRWAVGPADPGWGNFALPGCGLAGKWRAIVPDLLSTSDPVLVGATLLATLALTAQVAAFAATAGRRALADPWWRLGAAYAALLLLLGPAVWEGYPGAAPRVLLPLTLAFNVLACRRRLGLAWLLVGNLAVPAGLLGMKDLPDHGREIAAAHATTLSYIARLDAGWYSVEQAGRHTKAWCSREGVVSIETWPHATRTLRLGFSMRSLGSRTVVVRQGPEVLWQGLVTTAYSEVAVPFRTQDGRATLVLSTDSPGLPEGSGPEARILAFNLRDPEISLSGPQSLSQ